MLIIRERPPAGTEFEGEIFRGRTDLDFDGSLRNVTVFRGCEFRGGGFDEDYALYVPPNRMPFARFIDCTFHSASKCAVAQYCWFEGCEFYDAEDGIFAQSEGHLHIEANYFRDMGGKPGHHPDAIQFMMGGNSTIRWNLFNMDDCNAWAMIESQRGRVEGVVMYANAPHPDETVGPGYNVYLWEDGAQAPKHCHITRNLWGKTMHDAHVATNFKGAEAQHSRNQTVEAVPQAALDRFYARPEIAKWISK